MRELSPEEADYLVLFHQFIGFFITMKMKMKNTEKKHIHTNRQETRPNQKLQQSPRQEILSSLSIIKTNEPNTLAIT